MSIGNETDVMTSLRRKSLVFHVTSAAGFVAIALARMGASLVGRIWYARRISASEGARVISGGMRRNEAHAVARRGNFNGIFRSASSMICGEITGMKS